MYKIKDAERSNQRFNRMSAQIRKERKAYYKKKVRFLIEVGSEMQPLFYSVFHILRFAYCENINLFCIFVETGEYESIPDKRLSRFTLFLRQEK